MIYCVASISMAEEPGNQDVAVVLVPTEWESATDSDSREAASASSVVHVSLSTLAEQKQTVLDDSILDEDTCDMDGCSDDCRDACGRGICRQFWARADYLLWWTRGSDIPPLVTTSTNPSDNGILGQPTTEILYGGSRQTSDARSSARITMGYWFDCCQCFGIQFDYFNLGSGDNNYSKDCNDGDLMALPIHRYYPRPEGEAAQLICKENEQQGRVRVDSGDYFDSFGIMGRWNICSHQPCCYEECCEESSCDTCGPRNRGSVRYFLDSLMKYRPAAYRVDFIAGYRNYNLDDLFGMHEHFVIIEKPGYPPGSSFDIQDSFRADNEFHGGELGVIATSYHGRWSFELLAKVALGNNNQSVSINGHTHVERPGQSGQPPLTADYDSGVLALETNIGRYHRDEFV
ncbi:MAG: BBP7 family outer membrane beta-barrel protein, partial [Planctomycetota bacterium]|nr:BBP7 family outer membrane beta-barrel protein [Planctomycetota bacterium]